MIKKYKLKTWVIEVIVVLLFTLLMTACVYLYFYRIESIDDWNRVVELNER